MRPTMMPTILPRNALAAAIAALMLAGCATADSAHRSSAAQAAPAQPPRGTAESAKAAGSDDSLQQGGITRAKINATCWMKYEKGRNDRPLDTRADLVNRCVGEALKRYHME